VPVAVDSSILFDVFPPDPVFGEGSRAALQAHSHGALVVCDFVWAEVRAKFPDQGLFLTAVDSVGGRIRRRASERIVADSLIGAHAQLQANALLARDRGFYPECFKDLRMIDPTRLRT
jgi:predicted nucleic acid-binding protein